MIQHRVPLIIVVSSSTWSIVSITHSAETRLGGVALGADSNNKKSKTQVFPFLNECVSSILEK